MSKYINADSLIELTRKTTTENSAERFINMIINSVYVGDTLNIVRCKDCKYADVGGADVWCECYESYKDKDGYCDDGERKETE